MGIAVKPESDVSRRVRAKRTDGAFCQVVPDPSCARVSVTGTNLIGGL